MTDKLTEEEKNFDVRLKDGTTANADSVFVMRTVLDVILESNPVEFEKLRVAAVTNTPYEEDSMRRELRSIRLLGKDWRVSCSAIDQRCKSA